MPSVTTATTDTLAAVPQASKDDNSKLMHLKQIVPFMEDTNSYIHTISKHTLLSASPHLFTKDGTKIDSSTKADFMKSEQSKLFHIIRERVFDSEALSKILALRRFISHDSEIECVSSFPLEVRGRTRHQDTTQ